MPREAMRPLACFVCALVLAASSALDPGVSAARSAPAAAPAPAGAQLRFGFSSPEAQGMDPRPLIDLAEWIRDHPRPIFSFLVSKNGQIVFELYTSSLTRDD